MLKYHYLRNVLYLLALKNNTVFLMLDVILSLQLKVCSTFILISLTKETYSLTPKDWLERTCAVSKRGYNSKKREVGSGVRLRKI